MNDTQVTMVGNVLTAPEWRRTANTGTYVMTFRFAATSRRFDRNSGRWVDGDSLRLKVACWRTLGRNASESIQLGDPLVIFGRIYSRDWIDSDKHKRTSYELDAITVGHDLSRGVAKFARRRPAGATDSVNDAESRAAIGGELSTRVDAPSLPDGVRSASELFDDFDPELFDTNPVAVDYREDDEETADEDAADETDDDAADGSIAGVAGGSDEDPADESIEDDERELSPVG